MENLNNRLLKIREDKFNNWNEICNILETNAMKGELITELKYLSESTIKRLEEEGLLVQKNTRIIGGNCYIVQCKY